MRKTMQRTPEAQRAYEDWLFTKNTNIPRRPSLWWRFLRFIGWLK